MLAFCRVEEQESLDLDSDMNRERYCVEQVDAIFDEVYFVGESTTAHLYKAGIERSHILVPSTGTLTLSANILNERVGASDLNIPHALNKCGANTVIITIGLNRCGGFNEKEFKTYYSKLIDEIALISPNTRIILQSVFPVTQDFSASTENSITNERIDLINSWTEELCDKYMLQYLDTQSVLKDAKGNLVEEYCVGDGVHLTEKAYRVILEYIGQRLYFE